MGRKTFVMRWLNDGSVKLSKNAPKEVQALAASGLLDQGPLVNVRRPRKPRGYLLQKFKKAPEGVNSNNKYNVRVGQVWESLDPRQTSFKGEKRQVRILEVGETHALVQGLRFDTKSLINLSRFSGKTVKGYQLRVELAPVQAAAQQVLN